MKKKLFIVSTGLFITTILGFITLYFIIDTDVKKNIRVAKETYSGTAEDALIAYLSDTANTPQFRTKVAIWTLGRIQSKKAIPILRDLYKNDPEGKTCYGKHDSVICQYEIHKAINACEVNRWPLLRIK